MDLVPLESPNHPHLKAIRFLVEMSLLGGMACDLKLVKGGGGKMGHPIKKTLTRAKAARRIDVDFPMFFPRIVVFIFWVNVRGLGIGREAGV